MKEELQLAPSIDWPREGAQSFEATRLRLVDWMDRLLDFFAGHPDYVFDLDGQAVCLDDYLEIRPHRRGEIERHIRDGRLRGGPWYVRNDARLCSGEASVRNLLLGSELFQSSEKSGRFFQWLEKREQMDSCGSLSLQPHLKLLNVRCQNLLELELEPLYAQLCRQTAGAVEYPADMLDYLWKELVKSQAADSLSGLGVERVHLDNENRFLRILDAGEALRKRGLKKLVERIDRRGLDSDGYLLTVVNTLPYERAEFVEAELHPLAEDALHAFGLLDESGNPVEFDLLETTEEGQLLKHRIRFRIMVPPSGYRTLRLFRNISEAGSETLMRPAPQGWVMQNEYMRVVVGADGQVDLLDSETGIESHDLLGFEAASDSGRPVVTILENRGVRLEYGFGVTLDLSLNAGCRHLAAAIQVDGRQRTGRLRLLVHTDVHSEEDISSQPFGCVRRDQLRGPLENGTESNNGLVSARDWNKQMSIFNDGMYEYEHLRDARGTIALTLMHATAAGAASSPRNVAYRLAIRPGQAGEAMLLQEMQCFHVPMLAVFGAVDERKFDEDAGLPECLKADAVVEKNLPVRSSGLVMDEGLVFSALKRSFDRSGWMLRFYNPAEAATKAMLCVAGAVLSDLEEEDGSVKWMVGSAVAAKEIVTLKF